MAKRTAPAGVGRPSKGDRKVMYSRVPRELVERIEAEAERLDVAFSDVIVTAIAHYYGLSPVVPGGQAEHQMQLTA